MRTTWKAVLLACALLAPATGCNRNKGPDATAEDQAGLVEERDDGKLEWIVLEDGSVKVKVTLNEGTTPALSGALLLDGQSYPLKADGPTLTATIPKLTQELTTITYSLKVGDSTWDGVLHVPPGGTKELVAAPSVTLPEDAKGPHGGVLDVIGDQRVEIVVDDKTGEVRVYMLNEKLEPIPVGSSSAVVGFAQDKAPDKAAEKQDDKKEEK